MSLPNPNTTLAYLPPTLATQFEVSRYIYAATLGAYIWDIVINLGNDYKLLFHYKMNFSTVIYYLSRLSTLNYILTSLIFQVANVPDCQALQIALGICLVVSQSTTAMLFLLRVLAVWQGNKIISGVFISLWAAVSISSITVPLGTKGAHIGPTQQCINTQVAGYIDSVMITGLINDSAIVAAISYRIMRNCVIEGSFEVRVRTFLGHGSIPQLSRALLRGGQHYYLIAVGSNIVMLLLLKDPSVPAVYHAMISIPAISLINAMACIVFRNIKFGYISADGTTRFPSTDQSPTCLNKQSGNCLPLHVRSKYPQDEDLYSRRTTATEVKVTQVVELDAEYERDASSLPKTFQS
ncbi:hypothetical protein BD769DRAFT_1700952 [Suillus cothurnatus]|nr:hypothetical protein BD769DRAFT_1700952 [Suillus cothurnatus]